MLKVSPFALSEALDFLTTTVETVVVHQKAEWGKRQHTFQSRVSRCCLYQGALNSFKITSLFGFASSFDANNISIQLASINGEQTCGLVRDCDADFDLIRGNNAGSAGHDCLTKVDFLWENKIMSWLRWRIETVAGHGEVDNNMQLYGHVFVWGYLSWAV